MLVQRDAVLPVWYSSLMDAETKRSVAESACDHVRELGMQPIAASVTGSRLRGLDHAESDTDVLVVVADKLHKALTVDQFDARPDAEGQVQSLDMFLSKLSTSLPYVEFWQSPFLVAEDWTIDLFNALRINTTEFEFHAQRFAFHIANRKQGQAIEKRARNIMAARNVILTMSPLCNRGEFDLGGAFARETAQWLEAICADVESVRDVKGSGEMIGKVLRTLREEHR